MNNRVWEGVHQRLNVVFFVVLKKQGRIIPALENEGFGWSNLIQILQRIPFGIAYISHALIPIAREEEGAEQHQTSRYDCRRPPRSSCAPPPGDFVRPLTKSNCRRPPRSSCTCTHPTHRIFAKYPPDKNNHETPHTI